MSQINEKAVPELLAPAGSRDALVAAISSGADAVYLGGKRFGARKYAANFSDKELEGAIEYAHARDVKVYVTVNTLVRDAELEAVGRHLVHLYEMGADAVLIQDHGTASIAREVVPEMELHASTQMTIHNLEGARMAKQAGLSRVVPARELTIPEIERLAREGGMGIEVFVHGALCYCYSGQCLMSSLIGGRSGNRGACAQPCRKQYKLVKGQMDEHGRPVQLTTTPLKDRYLLSTRDLCLYENLEELVGTGIAALKIEGRMKSPEYVATVTRVYRRALDSLARGEFNPGPEDIRELYLAFNREFTRGYTFGASGKEFMGHDRPGNRGLRVGQVSIYDTRRHGAVIELDGSVSPEEGDGLEFRPVGEGQGFGLVARGVEVRGDAIFIPSKRKAEPGMPVYITRRKTLHAEAARAYRSPSPVRRIPVSLTIFLDDQNVPILEGLATTRRNGSVRATHKGNFHFDEAATKPLTTEQIKIQLSRTGSTQFEIVDIQVDYPGGLFAPIARLNELRRGLLEKLEKAMLDGPRPNNSSVQRSIEAMNALVRRELAPSLRYVCDVPASAPPLLTMYINSIETAEAASRAGVDRVYLEPALRPAPPSNEVAFRFKDQTVSALKAARSIAGEAQLYWMLPRILRGKTASVIEPVVRELDGVIDGICLGDVGMALYLAGEGAANLPLHGSSSLNLWNHRALHSFAGIFDSVTASPELSGKDLRTLASIATRMPGALGLEVLVQGNVEVMLTEDCIPTSILGPGAAIQSGESWGLRDSRKRVFPIHVDGERRTHVLNAVELCLVDSIPAIMQMGISSVAIDARYRTPLYVEKMARLYKLALAQAVREPPPSRKELLALKEEAKALSLGGITAGHYRRGLAED